MPPVSLIVPAAGQGRRFGAAGTRASRKPFVTLAGEPVVAHALRRFAQVDEVAEVILAVDRDDVDFAASALADVMKLFGNFRIIAGGAERPDTVAAALKCVDAASSLVAVHDAVRPLVAVESIRRAIKAADNCGAAIVAVPVSDTVKRVGADGMVAETVSRDGLWVAQTPQVFRRQLIIDAYRNRHALSPTVTDDAQLVEAMGVRVAIIEGSATNLKITTPEDLQRAEALLRGPGPPSGK